MPLAGGVRVVGVGTGGRRAAPGPSPRLPKALSLSLSLLLFLSLSLSAPCAVDTSGAAVLRPSRAVLATAGRAGGGTPSRQLPAAAPSPAQVGFAVVRVFFITNPRSSPLTVRYECPQLSLLIITSDLETNKQAARLPRTPAAGGRPAS